MTEIKKNHNGNCNENGNNTESDMMEMDQPSTSNDMGGIDSTDKSESFLEGQIYDNDDREEIKKSRRRDKSSSSSKGKRSRRTSKELLSQPTKAKNSEFENAEFIQSDEKSLAEAGETRSIKSSMHSSKDTRRSESSSHRRVVRKEQEHLYLPPQSRKREHHELDDDENEIDLQDIPSSSKRKNRHRHQDETKRKRSKLNESFERRRSHDNDNGSSNAHLSFEDETNAERNYLNEMPGWPENDVENEERERHHKQRDLRKLLNAKRNRHSRDRERRLSGYRDDESSHHSTSESRKPQVKFTLFYSNKFPFSNHYLSPFEVDGERFNCGEQYYMYQKAVIFNAPDIAQQILQSEDPREQKRLALRIPSFDTELWYSQYAKPAMWKGLCAKFNQNADVRRALLETHGTILVECSPKDVRWGIGWPITSPNCLDPTKWRGTNWLGKQLTKLREKIIADSKYSREVRRYVPSIDRRRTL